MDKRAERMDLNAVNERYVRAQYELLDFLMENGTENTMAIRIVDSIQRDTEKGISEFREVHAMREMYRTTKGITHPERLKMSADGAEYNAWFQLNEKNGAALARLSRSVRNLVGPIVTLAENFGAAVALRNRHEFLTGEDEMNGDLDFSRPAA